MAHGELGNKALKWATKTGFGLDPASMPPEIVITPLKIEECFTDFHTILTNNALRSEKVGNGYLVWKNDRRALFCEGGIGASNFADSSYVLCHCRNAKEIIFVGTGAGIGKDVEIADVNVPTSCIRLDKVLEIFLLPEAPANADSELSGNLRIAIENALQDLSTEVYSGMHATVPFFLSETKELD
jgi:purine-nucleoside phosphorylase